MHSSVFDPSPRGAAPRIVALPAKDGRGDGVLGRRRARHIAITMCSPFGPDAKLVADCISIIKE